MQTLSFPPSGPSALLPDIRLSALVLGVALLPVAWCAAAPVARCEADTFAFGTIPDHATVRHVFRIANTGDAPLMLQSVSVCCGAKAVLPRDPIPTNGTGDVSVELTLVGRRGPVNKAIYVSTNDPKQPHLRLSLTGLALAGLTAAPERLTLTDNPTGLTSGVVVRLTSDTVQTIRVTNVWGSVPWLRATAVSLSNGVAAVRVEIVPPIPEESASATVQVAVDRVPGSLSIPVTAKRWDAVIAFPKRLFLSRSGPDAPPVERSLTLSARDGRSFTVRSVRLEGMAGRADIRPATGGRWHVSLAEIALPSATSTGTVVVATDHPLRPELRILVCPVSAAGD
jgi:hypothetical protein